MQAHAACHAFSHRACRIQGLQPCAPCVRPQVQAACTQQAGSVQAEKVAEAEHEVYDAGTRLEAAQAQYESIVHCMSRELARFQRERAAETRALLRSFALSQVRTCSAQCSL